MTSVAEIDTEKGFEKGFESDVATSFYNSGPEWERATRTFFLNSAAASFVTEIALFVTTTQITYNYKYQIMWCTFAAVTSGAQILAAVTNSRAKKCKWLRYTHLVVIVSCIVGAATSRYALMSSDMYVCSRVSHGKHPTFVNVNVTSGAMSLMPGKPSCARTRTLYVFELLALGTRLLGVIFTSRTL